MPYQNTDPKGAAELLRGDAPHTLVDVRTPEEFAAGHVPGAYNVPLLFRSPAGMSPNPAFITALEAHFEKDAALVFQ